MNNYICIGDIHGRYDLLCQLLEKIAESPFRNHRKIILGDMIDRGPDSWEVLLKCKELQEKEDAIVLYGNHEDFMVDSVGGYRETEQGLFENPSADTIDLWCYNGGNKTIKSISSGLKRYGWPAFHKAFQTHEVYRWVRGLPLFFEDETIWCSHAPVPAVKYYKNGDNFRSDKQAVIWSFHGNFGAKEDQFARDLGKIQVVGHVHGLLEGNLEPRVYDHVIYADTGTGCWKLAPLAGVAIQDGKYAGSLLAWPDDKDTCYRELVKDIRPKYKPNETKLVDK